MTYRYQRYFDSEQDAKDWRSILQSMYPPEGYGTSVSIIPVSKWFLVAASWSSAD